MSTEKASVYGASRGVIWSSGPRTLVNRHINPTEEPKLISPLLMISHSTPDERKPRKKEANDRWTLERGIAS
jgi:hypothetical protein